MDFYIYIYQIFLFSFFWLFLLLFYQLFTFRLNTFRFRETNCILTSGSASNSEIILIFRKLVFLYFYFFTLPMPTFLRGIKGEIPFYYRGFLIVIYFFWWRIRVLVCRGGLRTALKFHPKTEVEKWKICINWLVEGFDYISISLCLCEWQSILTATGRLAIWHGYDSTCTTKS